MASGYRDLNGADLDTLFLAAISGQPNGWAAVEELFRDVYPEYDGMDFNFSAAGDYRVAPSGASILTRYRSKYPNDNTLQTTGYRMEFLATYIGAKPDANGFIDPNDTVDPSPGQPFAFMLDIGQLFALATSSPPAVNQAPVVTFTNPASGAVITGNTLPVSFDAVDYDGTIQFKTAALLFNGNVIATVNMNASTTNTTSFDMSSRANGVYTVRLTIVDDDSATTVVSRNVTLNKPAPATIPTVSNFAVSRNSETSSYNDSFLLPVSSSTTILEVELTNATWVRQSGDSTGTQSTTAAPSGNSASLNFSASLPFMFGITNYRYEVDYRVRNAQGWSTKAVARVDIMFSENGGIGVT